ncbi:MAG: DUF4382 domain-containing protein [Betaproteobacteria bacterium]|nr:DUF4382 domain-containing protein [Betaproteobacteria bacterium]
MTSQRSRRSHRSSHWSRTLRMGCLAVAVGAGLSACGGGGGGGGPTGVAQFRLTDAPVCSNVSSVVVTITRIELIGASGTYDLTLSQPMQQDLTQLVNGVSINLGSISVPAGTYQQVRLILASNPPSGPYANYVTVGTGTTQYPLFTPSAQQSGLKVNGQFTVAANGQVNLTMDFNACRSVVLAGNSGKYLLKPVINLMDDDSSGSISGSLSSAADAGAVVMAEDTQGHILRSTVAVADSSGTTASFTLAPIPAAAGPYNVVIAPPAAPPTPTSTTPSPNFVPTVLTGVPVTAGAQTSLGGPITLPPLSSTDDQVFSGSVTVASSDVDTLIVAQEPLGNSGQTISIASQTGEGDSSTQSYAMTLPTVAPQVAAYATSGTVTFTQSTTAPNITIAAYASDGEDGSEHYQSGQSTAGATIMMSGSSDNTFGMDH